MLSEIFYKYGYDDPIEEIRKEFLERLPTLNTEEIHEYSRMIEAWNRRPVALILHEVFAEQDRRWGITPEKSEAQVRYEMFPPVHGPEFHCKGGINDGFGTNLLQFLASEPFAIGHREAVETLRQQELKLIR